MEKKAFCQFTHGSLGKGITYKDGKFIFRVCVPGRKNKHCPHSWWGKPKVINWPPGVGDSYWFPCGQTRHLAVGIARSGLVSESTVLLSPVYPPSLEPMGRWDVGWGKRLAGEWNHSVMGGIVDDPCIQHDRMDLPIHLIIRILLCRMSHLVEHLHRTHCLHVFQTSLSTFVFLQVLVTNFQILFF